MNSHVPAVPIHLSRRDIKTTASATHGGLLVYSRGRKAKQRVAVGDRTGVVSVFSIGKRLDEVPVFTTAESDAAAGQAGQQHTKLPISCATLYTDQLFCIRGSVLDAYSRKGKHFFSVDTNATEKIHSLAVSTPFFFTAGEFMLTSFNEGKELGFFMAPDRVHEMVTFPVLSALQKAEPELRDFISCLACNDRVLRLVQENKLIDEIGCEAALTTIYYDPEHRQVLYGTQIGSIGAFDIVGERTLRRRCSHIPKQRAGQLGGDSGGGVSASITCLYLYDINLDEKPEILVGYDDGTVQVFAIIGDTAAGDASTWELQSIWCSSVGEKVVSIAAGAVTQGVEQPDLLVHVFSGQLIAFSLDLEDVERNNMESVQANEMAQRRQEQRDAVVAKRMDTEREITWLRETIAEKARLLALKTGAVAKKAPLVAVASTFTASVSLRPVDQSAMLSLTIDADVPLACALLRSTTADMAFHSTEFTQVSVQPQRAETSDAARAGSSGARPGSASSQSSPMSGAAGTRSKTLALATPLQQHEGTGANGGGVGNSGRRLEVLLWADEGNADALTVTLYATQAPRTAQVKTVPLCALPLYRRIGSLAAHFDSAVERQMVLSSVSVFGNFTPRQAADWLSRLLPDLPEGAATQQLQEASNARRPLAYYSAFLGTVLSIDFTDGAGAESSLVFTSDSLNALAVIKRHVVRQASVLGIAFRTKEHILFGSAARRLALLQPLMSRCAEAARQLQLLEGLRELQSSDTDLSYLPEGHQEVLRNAEAVQAEAGKQREHEKYLKRSVVALYNSLVQFREHAPRATAKLISELEGACCGTRYSASRLSGIFFPHEEDEQERKEILASVAAAEAYANAQQQQQQLDAQAPELNSGLLSSPSVSDLGVE